MARRPLAVLMLASAACVPIAGLSLGQEAQPDPLADLHQVFQTDAATAFEEAARMFEAPRAAKDLDGMMAIIGVVAPEAARCRYAAVVEDMIGAALPLAEAHGRWESLGTLLGARAGVSASVGGWVFGTHPRAIYFAQRAVDAYTKAGVQNEWVEQLRKLSSSRDLDEVWRQREEYCSRSGGPIFGPLSLEIDKAVCVGDDARAVSLMAELVLA